MKKLNILLLFLLIITEVPAQYNTVLDVPDPKKNGSGYISNPDRIMNDRDVQAANEILANLEANDTFQVAIVVLNSIGENVPKDFATDLFEQWGVGTRGRDDGVLVLFVNDQRRVEIETGDGTETVLSDVQCKNIIEGYMIPSFREGNYSEGLLAGVREIALALQGKIVDTYQVHENQLNEFQAIEEGKNRRNQQIYRWIVIGVSWHAIGLILFLIALVIARYQHDPYKKYRTIRIFHAWIWAILFPASHIFIVLLAKKLKQRYRDMIRFSGKTGEIMRKLEERDEDDYLSKGQITEELVKSVDYDVWITDKSDDVLVLEYVPMFSKYSKCPKCRFRTYYKVYDRQIVAPTYHSSGRGERKHQCENCQHVDLNSYTIPMLRRSNRTSSGGWSGSGRSGGGSFSGGGSWGGGRSSGGGAGGSW